MKKSLILFLFLFCAAASAREADLVLTGALTREDHEHYREVPFDVPEDVTRLRVDFSQDGQAQRTTIDLGLADPARFRGWSGSNKTSIVLSETDSTPSYLPGPIPAGHWRLLLGIPNIRPGVVTRYRAEVRFERADEPSATSHFSEAPLKTGPAWYRGDLHMHTGHSDGFCDSRSGRDVPCPLFKTIEAAEARGLDFVAITDHNNVSHYQAMREAQPFFDKTLLIPGREMTTFHGHGNAFGVVGPLDYRIDGEHLADADAMVDRIHAGGGLFSINHPTVPSGERCMGCGWEWKAPGFDFAKADGVEVVNGGTLRAVGLDESGLLFWQSLLDKGYRPTALAGSDNHDASARDKPGSVGLPTTIVHAASLSERDILAGIKAGHVFVDVAGSRDRLLDLRAGTSMMGDQVALGAGESVTLSIEIKGVAGGHVEIAGDAGPLRDPALDAALGASETRRVAYRGDGKRHWLAPLVRDKEGRIVLIGNPLYLIAP